MNCTKLITALCCALLITTQAFSVTQDKVWRIPHGGSLGQWGPVNLGGGANAVTGSLPGSSVTVDGSTISTNGSSQLYVPSSGIGPTQLGTVTDGATLDQNATGSKLEVKSSGLGSLHLGSTATDPNTIRNVGFSAATASNILTVTLTQSDGSSAPSATSPVVVSFANAAGGYTTKTFTATSTITVGTGASLGVTTAYMTPMYVYVIADTTSEICLSLTNFDSSVAQNATAIASNSSSSSTLYCTNAHTSKPIRMIGQYTASWTNGTGWGSPSAFRVSPMAEAGHTTTNYNAASSTGVGFLCCYASGTPPSCSTVCSSPLLLTNQTVTLTTHGNPVLITFSSDGTSSGSDALCLGNSGNYCTFSLKRNGTVVGAATVSGAGTVSNTNSSLNTLTFADSPPAGSNIYTLYVTAPLSGGYLNVNYMRIFAYEMF